MKFTSKYTGRVLQDEKGVWAHFVNGEFETDDKAVAERLRKTPDVEEVEPEKPARAPRKKATPAEGEAAEQKPADD